MNTIEIRGRLHEIVIVPGLIFRDGEAWDAYLDTDEQQILVSDSIAERERPAVVMRAAGISGPNWNLIPVLGRVS